MTLVTVCPCGKVIIMYRSLRGIACALILALLVLGATPATAETTTETIVMQFLDWIIDLVSGDKGADIDPNGLSADGGPLIDPDGQDRGPDPDPDGLATNGGPLIDPNG